MYNLNSYEISRKGCCPLTSFVNIRNVYVIELNNYFNNWRRNVTGRDLTSIMYMKTVQVRQADLRV